MTDRDRAARGHRAAQALDEFVGPAVAAYRATLLARIGDVAVTELNSGARADKLSSLSLALRVADEIEGGIKDMIRDGEYAVEKMSRVEKIERMTPAKRNLLSIGARY